MLEDKKETFEENLAKLEEIVKNLENGNVPLDDAINQFTEGMRLAKFCDESLKRATDAVNKILTENNELKDFSLSSEDKEENNE